MQLVDMPCLTHRCLYLILILKFNYWLKAHRLETTKRGWKCCSALRVCTAFPEDLSSDPTPHTWALFIAAALRGSDISGLLSHLHFCVYTP